MKNKYPIYIPSLHRADNNLTAELFRKLDIDFKLVVEKSDYENYARYYPVEQLLSLPGDNYGSVSVARNFIKAHARSRGFPKHWQIDDDIPNISYVSGGKIINNDAMEVLANAEKFCDRYSNIGMAGLSSNNFIKTKTKPFNVNTFAYGCVLISDNDIQWRNDIEDDLDYNLQVLSNRLCTIRFNAFIFHWSPTGKRKGGYTELYADGKRLERMKKTLEYWPQIKGIVKKQGGEGYRLNTNSIWRLYPQQLLKI